MDKDDINIEFDYSSLDNLASSRPWGDHVTISDETVRLLETPIPISCLTLEEE